jgi:hypothetical protein
MPSTSNALSAVLARSLAGALADSGLFYEAHLAQWLAGTRTLASLVREPQAQPGFGAAGVLATPAPPQGGATLASVFANPSPVYGFSSASHAAPAGALPTPRADGSAPGDVSPAAGHAVALPPGIGPDTAAIVRQQLDLLNSSQFHWVGEAWPGAQLDWTIEPRDAHTQSAEAAGRAWRSRVEITLPSLGTIAAEFMLDDTRLHVKIDAQRVATDALQQDARTFHERIAAVGLQLENLTIRAAASTTTLAALPAAATGEAG